MRTTELVKMTCTIARSVDAIGDPWMIMIMKELFLGQRRFDDIQTYTGISPHLLSGPDEEARKGRHRATARIPTAPHTPRVPTNRKGNLPVANPDRLEGLERKMG